MYGAATKEIAMSLAAAIGGGYVWKIYVSGTNPKIKAYYERYDKEHKQ